MTSLGIDLEDLGIETAASDAVPDKTGTNLVIGSVLAKALYSIWSGVPVTIVDNPPGAGETTLVTDIVAHLHERGGLRIGIASPTRRGAYDIAERIAAKNGTAQGRQPARRPRGQQHGTAGRCRRCGLVEPGLPGGVVLVDRLAVEAHVDVTAAALDPESFGCPECVRERTEESAL